jgi:hypothetical protein
LSWATDPDPYAPFRPESKDFAFTETPWLEAEAAIPPLPPIESFTLASVDAVAEGFDTLIHVPSYQIHEQDDIARFWYALRSPGAVNIKYEAFRCSTQEYKSLAYGAPGREPSIRPVPNPVWAKIGIHTQGNYRLEIARRLVCEGTLPKPLDRVVQSVEGRYEALNPYSELTNSSLPGSP